MKKISLFAILAALLGFTAHALDVGTANQVLRVPPAGGLPKYGKVNLASPAAVVSPLPSLNGGLGIDASAATGVAKFASGTGSVSTIVNADISASAGIVDTKLATISTAGKVSGSAITSGTIGGSTIINTSGDITGGTITGSSLVGPVTGNASTATALAANPADCAADTYATTIAASGALTCSTVTNAGLAGSIAYSKLSLTGAILNADLAGSIADSKLSQITTAGKVSTTALTGSIASTIGGTGVSNVGSLTYGSNNITLTTTGTTSVTLPVAGSLISSGASSAERIERAVVTTSSTGSVCTVNSQSGTWLGATTPGGSAGVCTLNFTGSPFSAAPTCVGSGVQTGNNRIITIDTATTSLVKFYRTDGGTPADGTVNLICMGPK